MNRLLFGFVIFCSHVVIAQSAPDDLVVFPENLPEVMNSSDRKVEPVLRMDKVPRATLAGVQLIPRDKSAFKSPEAAMAYAVPGYGTLLIHVIDDSRVAAPANRLAQEHVMVAAQPRIPGYEPPVTRKIAITCATGSGPVDAYFTTGKSTHPTLIMIVPDKKAADRFSILFSWVGATTVGGDEPKKIVTEWLPRAAATLDLAKLQAAP